ncbi:ATPase/histidine kinase/DNA gyrase B/HSP90 domain protein [delta proteobacterium NaphS2]|nr:ATPase/histidine kinase/DNA gyrase B/HSP90 domain protein [delta proteobacterium NaphS2]
MDAFKEILGREVESMSKGKIMVVEDDEDLAEILTYNITMRGYRSVKAFDGIDACRAIEAEMPDLVLLDIMLPRLDGWQICKFIRNHNEGIIAETPIIMLTALGSQEEKLKGIEMGADDYIPKPFSVKEVMFKVDRLLGREAKRKRLKAEIERLESREAQRTDFQGMLFHELKNQLTIIGGFSRVMVENPSLAPEKYRHCAGVINECSSSLDALTEEVLLLLRLEAGNWPLPLDKVSVEEILHQLIGKLSKQAQKKGITIQSDLMAEIPHIRQNAAAIKLAIGNLIENAVKYSPDQSVISVRAEFQNHKGVIIEVLDEGPGISQLDRERVFERFYRGQSTRKETKGMGLGLYISKTLTERMGGSIDVKSGETSGTCFTVTIPTIPAHSLH